MQTYAEQQASITIAADRQSKANRVTQLRACGRHYQDMMARITALPIDPSGDAVIVRTDVATFIAERIDQCNKTIAALQAQPGTTPTPNRNR